MRAGPYSEDGGAFGLEVDLVLFIHALNPLDKEGVLGGIQGGGSELLDGGNVVLVVGDETNNGEEAKVSNSQLVASNEVLAVGLEFLLEMFPDVCGEGSEDSNLLLTELLGEKKTEDLRLEDVGGGVEGPVDVVGFPGVSGVVAVLDAKGSEDGSGLVGNSSVVEGVDGQLAAGEGTLSLQLTELLVVDTLVLEVDLGVGEEHADRSGSSLNSEVGKLGHFNMICF